MSQRDYYQMLGVPRDASPADIRGAYARLVKLHHPDLTSNALPTRLQDLQHAYHCLSNAISRAAHDHALSESERAHFARQRAVRRHLRRYDGRRPRPQPRVDRGARWGWILLVATSIVVALRIAMLVTA